MESKDLISLEVDLSPLTKTEENQLKGGFSLLKTKNIVSTMSPRDTNRNCHDSEVAPDDSNSNCYNACGCKG